ncbi:amidase [Myxococcota bacterium]|nr:amidase [Myxococcota bacterium]
MEELLDHSLSDLTQLLARRDASAEELMRATLARIRTTHDRLNAFVALADEETLIEQARTCDERLSSGQGRVLEGIPFGVKDLQDARGFPTTHASVPFRDHDPDRDSIQVARLKDAGAIVVGKTNTPEFGYTALTKNRVFGATRNPWDLERTPGGSSGGSAAAIAAGVIPLATATDGGGSIRIPASFTGCFGLKTSYGRIPMGPSDLWTNLDTSVTGPLSRTVMDAALHLDVVAGPHPLDPNSLPHPGSSYCEVLKDLPSGLRIGFSPDLGYAVVQSDVATCVERAAAVFEEIGHHLETIPDGPPEPGADWGLAGAFELHSELHEMLPERMDEFGRSFIRGVAQMGSMDAALWHGFRKRREELNRWCALVFDRYDLLLTPTVPYDPPAATGPLRAEVEGRKQPIANVGSFTMPFNLSWHPAATVRAGQSRAGLPIGLQIVGPRHRDDLVLQASHTFEQMRPWNDDWPRL